MAAINAERAWLIVGKDQGPELLEAVRALGDAARWRLHPVAKVTDPDAWISVTFPRVDIAAATELLQHTPRTEAADGSRGRLRGGPC